MSLHDFDAAFTSLTGNPPFPWQQALYVRFQQGDYPKTCNLPTGLGKTSVIAIWLIALAHGYPVPRRLVYVVNRRTVVDQTTDEVERFLSNLPAGINDLAVSTLRGQYADNREWSADPSRPAVICGTVDMIGSRLLFSGYGIGFKGKPLHAGFLGQDVLLIHDEAHLEPAFQQLLLRIEEEQHLHNDLLKLRVIELSATTRDSSETFELTPGDLAHAIVQQRVYSAKQLNLHVLNDEKKLAEELIKKAKSFDHRGEAILIFTRRVDDVEKIAEKLPDGRVCILTGTMRGKERDQLINQAIFKRFMPKGHEQSQQGTVYLVCTSAGEVGVNISADHLICDLSTFDSMVQRFGRVNRFGFNSKSEIHVYHPTTFDVKKPYELARMRTLALLRELLTLDSDVFLATETEPNSKGNLTTVKGNASPAALGQLNSKARIEAFAPQPRILQTSDILFDAWSLTTIREDLPGRPPVEPYLHGINEDEYQLPETHVAWRDEVDVISTDELIDLYPPRDLLEDYPLKSHELLRDHSARLFDRLKKFKNVADKRIWVLSNTGDVQVTTFEELINCDKEDIYYKTLVLPTTAGGLAEGMLRPDSPTANDVADEWIINSERMRLRTDDDDEPSMTLIREIVLSKNAEDEVTKAWYWFERKKSSDAGDYRTKANRWYPLDRHLADAEMFATNYVKHLQISAEIKEAVIIAAMFHDLGKDRKQWQRNVGNLGYPTVKWAKSGFKIAQTQRSHYRHEFGSLLDIAAQPRFNALSTDMQELVLHLIAAHHGRARPHFPVEEAFDPEPRDRDVDQLATDIPRRFARLQRQYGRWGLAYLESLVRAADIAASQLAENGGES